MTTENSINRVLRSHGLPELGSPGVVAALAYLVEDHVHFTELLRACEPWLRREMYEAMRPHLRFPAKSLDEYIAAAQEHAMAAELPTLNGTGGLDPYMRPVVVTEEEQEAEESEEEDAEEGDENDDVDDDEDDRGHILLFCYRCRKEGRFPGERIADRIQSARRAGWGYDESAREHHLCPECLNALA
jgi:hypothetical protein